MDLVTPSNVLDLAERRAVIRQQQAAEAQGADLHLQLLEEAQADIGLLLGRAVM
ncbi:hypothetical protein [Blastococcus sp. SYSU D01042]